MHLDLDPLIKLAALAVRHPFCAAFLRRGLLSGWSEEQLTDQIVKSAADGRGDEWSALFKEAAGPGYRPINPPAAPGVPRAPAVPQPPQRSPNVLERGAQWWNERMPMLPVRPNRLSPLGVALEPQAPPRAKTVNPPFQRQAERSFVSGGTGDSYDATPGRYQRAEPKLQPYEPPEAGLGSANEDLAMLAGAAAPRLGFGTLASRGVTAPSVATRAAPAARATPTASTGQRVARGVLDTVTPSYLAEKALVNPVVNRLAPSPGLWRTGVETAARLPQTAYRLLTGEGAARNVAQSLGEWGGLLPKTPLPENLGFLRKLIYNHPRYNAIRYGVGGAVGVPATQSALDRYHAREGTTNPSAAAGAAQASIVSPGAVAAFAGADYPRNVYQSVAPHLGLPASGTPTGNLLQDVMTNRPGTPTGLGGKLEAGAGMVGDVAEIGKDVVNDPATPTRLWEWAKGLGRSMQRGVTDAGRGVADAMNASAGTTAAIGQTRDDVQQAVGANDPQRAYAAALADPRIAGELDALQRGIDADRRILDKAVPGSHSYTVVSNRLASAQQRLEALRGGVTGGVDELARSRIAGPPAELAGPSTAPPADAAPVSAANPVAVRLAQLQAEVAAAGGQPTPQQQAQLNGLSAVNAQLQSGKSTWTALKQRFGLAGPEDVSRALNDPAHPLFGTGVGRVGADPTLPPDAKQKPGYVQSVWQSLPDWSKALVIGGVTLGGVGLVASLFSGSDDEEDSGGSWVWPILGLAGAGAALYGLSGGGGLAKNVSGLWSGAREAVGF